MQGGCNPHQRVHGDVFLAALDVADVVAVEIGLFGQLLLAPPGLPAMRADILA